MTCCSLCSEIEEGSSSLVASSFLPPEDTPQAILGTQMPEKPLPALPETVAPKIQRRIFSRSCCGRPGEPLNKVCLLVSSDLEGFLPYKLIISEDKGFNFTSLSPAPDFLLEPAHLIKVQRITFEAWEGDRSFGLLCRTVEARRDLSVAPDWTIEDRIRPPYIHLVHIVAMDSESKGLPPDLTILVGVQTEALAEELMRSCLLLKKRQALREVNRGAPGGAKRLV
mmetsp:Transcript_37201/g.58809  ORF Transcript_37201/g.58809 Transcript_37201/m.58809 type:complete len:225 (+) Transcript_37201:51-725(+)